MKVIDLYRLAVKKGMDRDPRTRAEIRAELAEARREYRKAVGPDKKAFDRERLTNPYADTRILYGDHATDVRRVMVGIDMEGPELLAACELGRRGRPVDLVMAHHPEGVALARLADVMKIQTSCFRKCGVPVEVGKSFMKDRMGEVSRSVCAVNHDRSVDMARLLGIPFMCIHTPADNHVVDHLQKLFDRRTPRKLADILRMLKAIPEYADGMRKNAGPRILVGDPKKAAGKVFVDMTGGTEGPRKIFPRLSQAGIGTIVAMHLSEAHYKHALGEHINVIIAGHIASDNLGLNLLLDEVEKKGRLDIIPCSGFTRVKR